MESKCSATITLDRDYVVSAIDERMYGSFVENLGRCIYGGIFEPGHPCADNNGFRRDVLKVVGELKHPIIRFPGGNYTASWRWEDSIGPVESRPARPELAWQQIETNRFGLNEFADWSTLNGSEIMMTVNMGTRGIEAALDLLEYCNLERGTYWSDKRIEHGYRAPYAIRTWCLGNEPDGDWQIGQKSAGEYARLARETAKAMKLLDPAIELVVAGSSNHDMPNVIEWERTVLEEAYAYVDYVSIHEYFTNSKGNLPNLLGKTLPFERFINAVVAQCDATAAKLRTGKKLYLSVDEYNVWHSITDQKRFENRWTQRPLLEDNYTFEDAVMLGSVLITLLRHADRVKIACLSELVNAISHIRTEAGGGVWCLPPYYAFQLFSRYGRGTVLQPVIVSPLYDSADFCDIPKLDAVPVLAEDGGLNLFAVNKDTESPLALSCTLRGFERYSIAEHIVFANANFKATNTKDAPHAVMPESGGKSGYVDGVLKASLPPLSLHVIRLNRQS